MEQDGTISTRGLKQDAVHYGELIFDVTRVFPQSRRLRSLHWRSTPRPRAAVDIVGGEQYILSAVMHADERNQGMSKAPSATDVWHYHLHVVYAPTTDQPFIGGTMAFAQKNA